MRLIWLMAPACALLAGCGGDHPAHRVALASSTRAMSAVDAASFLEGRLHDTPAFACSLLPADFTVRIVATDRATLDEARHLVPRLHPRVRLQLVLDRRAIGFRTTAATVEALRRSERGTLLVNLGMTVRTTTCPRPTIEITEGHRLTRAETRFLQQARSRYGSTIAVARVPAARAA